jgi:hypothetical protein
MKRQRIGRVGRVSIPVPNGIDITAVFQEVELAFGDRGLLCFSTMRYYVPMMNPEKETTCIRCRRLGHEVPLDYCQGESDGKPCGKIIDCWWETMDIRAFLAERSTPEELAELEKNVPPRPKIASLAEMIEQARERIEADKKRG